MPSKKRNLSNSGLPRTMGDAEARFMTAVTNGNLAYVKTTLSGGADTATINTMLHLTDSKDRTALEIATENEHFEIVLFIIEEHDHHLGLNEIHESLMVSITKGYVNITQVKLIFLHFPLA